MKRVNVINGLFLIMLTLQISISNAQLAFKDGIPIPITSPYNYVIGDVNNDKFPDMYISTNNFQSGDPGKIWINDKKGGFSAGQTIGMQRLTHRVAFADLDGDNDLDIFLANDASYANVTAYLSGCPNEVWFNDGAGNFTNSGQLLGFEPSNGISLVDVDKDGDIDAIVSNYHPANDLTYKKFIPDEVWLNNGKGIFSRSQTLGYGMGEAFLVDIDKDEDWDIVDMDTVWYNNGSGVFLKSLKTVAKNKEYYGFGDLDNDGDIDAFISGWNEPAEVWMNDGNGHFNNSMQQLGQLKSTNPQLIDIDNDGDLDVFTPNYNIPTILWINQGGKQNGTKGTFLNSGLTLPSGYGKLCDFNGDGKPDAILGTKIWLNTIETGIPGKKKSDLSVFPNPTSGSFYLKGNNNHVQDAEILLYSMDGKVVFSKKAKTIEFEMIDISNCPNGIYLIKIVDGKSLIFTGNITKTSQL